LTLNFNQRSIFLARREAKPNKRRQRLASSENIKHTIITFGRLLACGIIVYLVPFLSSRRASALIIQLPIVRASEHPCKHESPRRNITIAGCDGSADDDRSARRFAKRTHFEKNFSGSSPPSASSQQQQQQQKDDPQQQQQ